MIVLIRSGGDLASGVASRLYRAGLRVVITELPQPLVVRRLVSFAEAVYAVNIEVEGILAQRINDPSDTLRILEALEKSIIPVIVDQDAESIATLNPSVVVDGRMIKRNIDIHPEHVSLYIGLGPGFIPGENCHAVIETNRGHALGRVIWQGEPEADTGIPEMVGQRRAERVLRAPVDGALLVHAEIGDHLEPGQLVAEVAGKPVVAPFRGVLRGVLHPGIQVRAGLKIGDVDPRDDERYCTQISDKSLAIGGGVLEAILSRPDLRSQLWV